MNIRLKLKLNLHIWLRLLLRHSPIIFSKSCPVDIPVLGERVTAAEKVKKDMAPKRKAQPQRDVEVLKWPAPDAHQTAKPIKAKPKAMVRQTRAKTQKAKKIKTKPKVPMKAPAFKQVLVDRFPNPGARPKRAKTQKAKKIKKKPNAPMKPKAPAPEQVLVDGCPMGALPKKPKAPMKRKAVSPGVAPVDGCPMMGALPEKKPKAPKKPKAAVPGQALVDAVLRPVAFQTTTFMRHSTSRLPRLAEEIIIAPARPDWAAALLDHCASKLEAAPHMAIVMNVLSDCAGMGSDIFALKELAEKLDCWKHAARTGAASSSTISTSTSTASSFISPTTSTSTSTSNTTSTSTSPFIQFNLIRNLILNLSAQVCR